VDVIAVGEQETKFEAVRWAELFRRNRDRIDGSLRLADLHVPVLVQATPDTPSKMSIRDRRDSFCGKMSACNNLMQYGIPCSLTTLHTETRNQTNSGATSRMVPRRLPRSEGLAKLRIGAIGARPAAFNTVHTTKGSSKPIASPSKPSTSGNPRPHRAHEGCRRRRAAETGRHPKVRS
jgi:hypothetical protein